MKKVLLSFLFFLPMLANAESVVIDGLSYTLNPEDKTASCSCGPNPIQGDVTILTIVYHEGVGYLVTSIGDFAFHACFNLTSVNIPNSVTYIGVQAFYRCSSLGSITLPKSLRFINQNAFGKCTNLGDIYCKAEKVARNRGDEGVYAHSFAFLDVSADEVSGSFVYVPAESVEAFSDVEPWKSVGIKSLTEANIPTIPKCAKPEIINVNGKIDFTCETDGAEFVSNIIVNDAVESYNRNITSPKSFKVTVYAVKTGYEDSDITTAEFNFSSDTAKSGDVDGDGKVNVADHVKLSEIIMEQDKK